MSNKKTKKDALNAPFNMKAFVKDMIDKRTAEDVSIRQAAEACGLSKSTYSDIESGRASRIEHFVPVCNWLGVQVQYYLTAKK